MPQHALRSLATAVVLVLGAAGRASAQQSLSRPFELLPGERTSMQFSVTEPGKVTVTVQGRGEALVLSVTGPDGQVQEQTGSGTFNLTLEVPAARAAAGTRLWLAALRTARAYTTPPAGYASAPKPTATGTISVSGPIASEAALATLLQPQMTARQAMRPTAARLVIPDLSAPARAALDQRTAAAHALQLQAISTRLSPATQAMIQQRGGMSVTKTIDPAMQSRMAITGMRAAPAATQPAGGSVSRVGSSSGAATAASAPLAISSMSVNQGDPGTPVLFEGTGFGAQAGEVHFIIANGRDIKAPFTAWTESQILSQVPAADSLPAFSGYAYLLRGDGTKSALLPFAFKPKLAVVKYCMGGNDLADSQIGTPGAIAPFDWGVSHPGDHFVPVFGFAGYDALNLQTRLKNGWQAVQFEITHSDCATLGPELGYKKVGGVYVVETRAGSDSPYVKLRWWFDGGTTVMYRVVVTFQGPSGLAYR